MKEVEFYDVKSKDKFKSSEYEIREKGGRFFAVAKSPNGPHECWRVMSKDDAQSSGATIKKID